MKIAVLNGSPRKGNTAALVEAFADGAREAGHEVEVLHVGKMKIAGCMGCEWCHGKGEGTCIQKDDMVKVMPAYQEADMIVYASPIYYFAMTAQADGLQAPGARTLPQGPARSVRGGWYRVHIGVRQAR